VLAASRDSAKALDELLRAKGLALNPAVLNPAANGANGPAKANGTAVANGVGSGKAVAGNGSGSSGGKAAAAGGSNGRVRRGAAKKDSAVAAR
jgi:hypothetical protein